MPEEFFRKTMNFEPDGIEEAPKPEEVARGVA
jgi:hypothetical protein